MSEEVYRGAGVHGTDINPSLVLQVEEKPQHSNDPQLAALSVKPLMSALWTPSLCGIESSGPYVVCQAAVGSCVDGCGL